jgi:hypothetical protein
MHFITECREEVYAFHSLILQNIYRFHFVCIDAPNFSVLKSIWTSFSYSTACTTHRATADTDDPRNRPLNYRTTARSTAGTSLLLCGRPTPCIRRRKISIFYTNSIWTEISWGLCHWLLITAFFLPLWRGNIISNIYFFLEQFTNINSWNITEMYAHSLIICI